MTIQLLRNTRLWVSTAVGKETITKDNTYEILIQDDFSFNQDGNSTDITLNEAGPKPSRGSARFEDSINPADWSFSTYLRPYTSTKPVGKLTPDYTLWHCLASGSPIDVTNDKGVKINDVNMLVKFGDNQHHELTKLTLYWLTDNKWWKMEDVQVNQAEVSIDIDGIGMTTWSGQATTLSPLAAQPFDPNSSDYAFPDAVFKGASYIKNKLTTLTVKDNSDDKKYSIPITGGTLTIANNITYLTPSTLSRVDSSIGSFTGTFDVSGSLEAYLRTIPGDTGGTVELLAKLKANAAVKNSFTISIEMGGRPADSSARPVVSIVLPKSHLSTPSIETADVLSTSIDFKGIPSDMETSDELFLGLSDTYTAAQLQKLIDTGDGKAALEE